MTYFSKNLKFLRDSSGKSQNEIAFELGFNSSSKLSNYANGASKPEFDTLLAIAKYFNVSIDNLIYTDLTKSNKLKSPENTNVLNEPSVQYGTLKTITSKFLPLIPIEAIAGFPIGNDNPILSSECEYYSVPEFSKKADFLIRISGSSMYPKYNSGDIVACKKLPIDTFFQWNKTYVIDTIQGALVKRIKKSDSPDTVILVSDNDKYPEFEISKKDIHSLALVVGVIRFES